jgi:predicted DNA-binding transcriptional regulator AlpA
MHEAARMTVAELLPPRNPEHLPVDPERRIQARRVAERYDISVRTLDRWLQKSHLEFPQPVMFMHDVAGRVSARFWRLGDLIDWDRAQAVKHAQVAQGGSPKLKSLDATAANGDIEAFSNEAAVSEPQ